MVQNMDVERLSQRIGAALSNTLGTMNPTQTDKKYSTVFVVLLLGIAVAVIYSHVLLDVAGLLQLLKATPAAPHHSCAEVAVSNAYVNHIRVEHCLQSAQSGLFVISHLQGRSQKTRGVSHKSQLSPIYLPNELLTQCEVGHAVYRVRIVGSEIFYAELNNVDIYTIHAKYELLTSGVFHAEILQLYDNFTFCDLPILNAQLVVAKYTWNVQADWRAPCQNSLCTLCPPGPLSGRWVANVSAEPIAGLVQEMRDTHIYTESPPMGMISLKVANTNLAANELRWQPLEMCTIEANAFAIASWRSKCHGAAGLVCFVGDSQMRHIYSVANAIIQSNQTYTQGIYRHKQIPPSNWSRYIPARFGGEVFQTDFGNCSQVVVNIGQWPIGWPAGQRPWTIRQYKQRVIDIISAIDRRAEKIRNSTTWMSTHPHGLQRRVMGHGTMPPKDWRTDPYILQQNSAIRNWLSESAPHIRYLDTHNIIYPLSDLSYDGGAHYFGTQAHWAAAFVLNNVCR